MKLLHTICYISNARPDLTDQQIEEVFDITTFNNNNCDVTGILLYNMGHFFQVIEGEKDHIIDLYDNKIAIDSRHDNLFVVYNKPTAKPIFLGYDSKFNIVKTEEDLQKIKSYLYGVKSSTSDKLTRLLRPFVLLQKMD